MKTATQQTQQMPVAGMTLAGAQAAHKRMQAAGDTRQQSVLAWQEAQHQLQGIEAQQQAEINRILEKYKPQLGAAQADVTEAYDKVQRAVPEIAEAADPLSSDGTTYVKIDDMHKLKIVRRDRFKPCDYETGSKLAYRYGEGLFRWKCELALKEYKKLPQRSRDAILRHVERVVGKVDVTIEGTKA